jgi:molybdopterin converting factor small subunit
MIESRGNNALFPVFPRHPMEVVVELFGIARSRAGVSQTTAEGKCLGDVLADLASRFPALAESCIHGRRLRPTFTANLNGRGFVTSPETLLHEGDTVLLLSLDAGG